MTTLNEYEQKIIKWSLDRRIIQNSTLSAQTLKLVSEVGELADNVGKGRDIRDDIGDCFVVLCNLAAMSGVDMTQCVAVAYDDIKDRRGTMSANGVFIKESDNG